MGRGRGILAAGVAAAIVAGAVLTARATSVRRFAVEDLARRAPIVVVGTVASSSARLGAVPGGGTRIFTDHDLRDLSFRKGSAATRNLIVSVVGGSLRGRTLAVPLTPRLEEGRRYLLFLDPAEPLCHVVGWRQGAFPIEEGTDGTLRVLPADGGEPRALGEFLTGLDLPGETPR